MNEIEGLMNLGSLGLQIRHPGVFNCWIFSTIFVLNATG